MTDNSSIMDVHNNIIRGNNASSGGDIYIYDDTGTVNVYNNNFEPAKMYGTFTNESDNINADPQFADAENRDYHLSGSSPCIDVGVNVLPLILTADYEGYEREQGMAADIGAYEYDPGEGDYVISGQILFDGAGLADIQVNLTGYASATKTTDDNGIYRFTSLENGQYTVTPVHVFYDFDPSEESITVNGSNVGGISFTATAKDSDMDGVFDYEDKCPYVADDQSDSDGDGYGDACDFPGSVSGTVIDEDSSLGIEGVKVTTNTGKDEYTDEFGNYTITELNNGNYTLNTVLTPGYIDEYYDDTTDSQYAALVTVYPEQDTPGIDFVLTPLYVLTTSVSPSGNGSVDPDCSGPVICEYESGTIVIVNANEDNGYPFINWIGCDSPSNKICTMTMNADKSLTAVFDSCRYPARIYGGGYYSTLQETYNSAQNGNTIQSRDVTFVEDLNLNRNITINMEGGFDCDYLYITGKTTVQGSMTLNDGMVTIENFIIEDGRGGGESGRPDEKELFFPIPTGSHPTSTPP
jgi:hypothetical protein